MKLGRFVPCAIVALAGTMFLDTNMAAQIVQIGEMNTHHSGTGSRKNGDLDAG